MRSSSPPLKKRKDMEAKESIPQKDCRNCEGSASPDMFEEDDELEDPSTNKALVDCLEKIDFETTTMETDKVNRKCSRRGFNIIEIKGGPKAFSHPQLAPAKPSSTHVVLCLELVGSSESTVSTIKDLWDNDHVRMPFSVHNVYPFNDEKKGYYLKQRWDIIQEVLLGHLLTVKKLEEAILSYNINYSKIWDFSTLHYFFKEVMTATEVNCFFDELLPSMVRLALELPRLIKSPIPLLRQHKTMSITLSQLQIASLLANAFFCTFPRRNAQKKTSEYASFPDINFNRLFGGSQKKQPARISEKLKCLLHYFRRVCHMAPKGVVTFTRRHLPPQALPVWEKSNKMLRKLYITSEGTIEDDGVGMLQVDFANRRVGGGVLGWGCVQEEIRFVICPELIVARLFTESFDSTESLVITGCERFSKYKGYGDTFEWAGDYIDTTPRDSCGRIMCSIVAIDATSFRNPNVQYTPHFISRELNKAFCGFFNPDISQDHLWPVATGNWGCGVYRGNPKLKSLIQLMAASVAGRNLAYFTFGNTELEESVNDMYTVLVDNHVTVGQLMKHFSEYHEICYRNGKVTTDLYKFLNEAITSSTSLRTPSPKRDISSYFEKASSFSTTKDHESFKPTNHSSSSPKNKTKSSKNENEQDTGLKKITDRAQREVEAEDKIVVWACELDDSQESVNSSDLDADDSIIPCGSTADTKSDNRQTFFEVLEAQACSKNSTTAKTKISDYFSAVNN